MNQSRTKNLALNVILGYIAQICIILLQFLGRKIFVNYLSQDYLGINGLYSNILTVLSLAELGLNTVVQFYLYKPVAEDNKPLVRTLLNFFGKIYYIIAGAVLIIGLALIPFLKYIINSELEQNELILYYILFLLNTVISYFSAQKIALLAAYQDNRLHKLVTLFTNIVLQLMHILVLVIWGNYIVYVVTTLLTTLLNVVLMNVICNKRYPYITQSFDEVEFDKSAVIKDVFSTFSYKVGGVLLNNTTNIMISAIISTAVVGLYSNYYMVVTAIQGFIAIITTSLISMVGNLATEKNSGNLFRIFKFILLFYQFVGTYGFIGFTFLFNDLICIWLGEQYVLDNVVVLAISFNFYLTNAVSPIWMYREANGLFKKVKYLMLINAGVNIVLSIVLGTTLGLVGILLAPPLSRILTSVWYEPRILFKTVFERSSGAYWLVQIKYGLLAIFATVLSYFITSLLPSGFVFMFIKAMIYLLIVLILFFVGTISTEEHNLAMVLVKKIGQRIKSRLQKNKI